MKAQTKNKKELASVIIELWENYTHSKEGREVNVPPGLPVFNAVNFIYWLLDRYKTK